MPRLFVGLDVPDEIVTALAALRGGLPGARWADPANFHITLRFIGDIDRRLAREIEDALSDIDRDSLSIALTGLSFFGGDKPHTLYAGIAPSRPLMELQADCERILRRQGLPPETRKFTPHITLARLRAASVLDIADYLATHPPFTGLSMRIDQLNLFSAREMVGGGPYLIEAAYPLRSASGANRPLLSQYSYAESFHAMDEQDFRR